MRRLIHLTLSPASRIARLILGEKRLVFDPAGAEDPQAHLPVFVDLDGARCEGLWAVVDHLEGAYPEYPLVPEDPEQRRNVLRWLDWTQGSMNERATQKILFEKAASRFTGAVSSRAPDMNIVRQGREALRAILPMIGKAAEQKRKSDRSGLHAGRSRRGRASVGARLFRRSALERVSASG